MCVEILTSSTLECGCIYTQSLKRQLRVIRVDPDPVLPMFLKEEIWMQRYRGKRIWRCREKTATCKPRAEVLEEINPVATLILLLQPSELWKSWSHPGCITFLWQPEKTNATRVPCRGLGCTGTTGCQVSELLGIVVICPLGDWSHQGLWPCARPAHWGIIPKTLQMCSQFL